MGTPIPPKAVRIILTVVFFFLLTIHAQGQPDIAYYEKISSGLTGPMQVATAPGDLTGRLFIVEKEGIIRIWNGTSLLGTPYLDITAKVLDIGEQGLLSIAFHPQYATNGFFFVYYNNNSGNLILERYMVSADANVANPTPNPLSPIFDIPKPFSNHNGGQLQFKNEGGVNYLYIGTGDGGSANDPGNRAQDPSSMLGKMLRVDGDVVTNPIGNWAWGLRNPFRWSFDRSTGDMWIGDVGQDRKEEISYRAGGTYGANFGWVCFEADIVNVDIPLTATRCDTVATSHVPPIYTYDNPPSGSSSVVGGFVYRGTEYMSLQGYYLAVDFYSGRLYKIKSTGPGTWSFATQDGLEANISSISETSDGSTLYATSLATNKVFKIGLAPPLPVRLVSFSGKVFNGYNELKWSTESEEQIGSYKIQYSRDGRTYTSIGEVLSVNISTRNTYSFRHTIVSTSRILYRLEIVERDGGTSYSPVISLGEKDGSGISVYPTILSGRRVNISSVNEIENIQLVYSDGREVFSKNMRQSGYFILDLPVLAKGVYFIHLSGRDFRQVARIVVQ
jgi:glucose/arabinose dehydrogenase